jgi:hypothetical protein
MSLESLESLESLGFVNLENSLIVAVYELYNFIYICSC